MKRKCIDEEDIGNKKIKLNNDNIICLLKFFIINEIKSMKVFDKKTIFLKKEYIENLTLEEV